MTEETPDDQLRGFILWLEEHGGVRKGETIARLSNRYREAMNTIPAIGGINTQFEATISPEPNVPNPELIRQVDRFVALGIHNELRMSETDYRVSLEPLLRQSQPEQYRDRFIPIFVETRLSLSRQLELTGIPDEYVHINLEDVQNITASPTTPYLMWTHDASLYRGQSVNQAISNFAPDEVGCTLGEVVALWVQAPQLLNGVGIDAAGSHDLAEHAPCLYHTDRQAAVYSLWLGDAHPLWGALSRWNEVVTI